MKFTEKQIREILAHNPFEGDMDSGFRYLKNKMGKTRKDSECRNCLTTIKSGEQARLMSCVFVDDGEILHGKFCVKCCKAIATDSSGELFANRFKDR